MDISNYMKGTRKEKELVRQAKAVGCIAFRSAGKCPYDVVILNLRDSEVRFIQLKTHKKKEIFSPVVEWLEVLPSIKVTLEKIHFYRKLGKKELKKIERKKERLFKKRKTPTKISGEGIEPIKDNGDIREKETLI